MIYTEISSKNLLFDKIEPLYLDSFPPDERRNFGKIINLLDDYVKNRYKIIGIFLDDNSFAGFISIWDFEDFRYVEHFAILPQLRGMKIGESTLLHLQSVSSKPIVLEVEPPLDTMAKRRITFYERCGFKLHANTTYIQPPYNPESHEIELKLMSWGDVDIYNNCKIIKELHSKVYGLSL